MLNLQLNFDLISLVYNYLDRFLAAVTYLSAAFWPLFVNISAPRQMSFDFFLLCECLTFGPPNFTKLFHKAFLKLHRGARVLLSVSMAIHTLLGISHFEMTVHFRYDL